MATRLTSDDPLGLKIRRSVITSTGFPFEPDATVRLQLEELNQLLSKPVLSKAIDTAAAAGAHEAAASGARRKRNGGDNAGGNSEVLQLLTLPLTPKRVENGAVRWSSRSILTAIQKKTGVASLSDFVENTPALLQLKYEFLDGIDKYWSNLNQSQQMIVENFPAVTDYLILGAYYTKHIEDANALRVYILNSANPKFTVRSITDYATISAARTIIDSGEIRVDNPNDDDGLFVRGLKQNPLPLSAASFRTTLNERITGFVFDRDEEKIIDAADIDVPLEIKPLLIKKMQGFPIKITAKNARLYLPNLVTQILQAQGAPGIDAEEFEPSEEDFEVQFTDTTDVSADISRSGVLCAAQLFHAMVLGDELDVFGATNYLVHKRLIMNGGLRIESPALRSDIKTYALSNKFLNLKDRVLDDRTRPAERQMFHRQVFNQGATPVPDDLPLNPEFRRLWSVLMLESARYLERAQASFNPENLVSRQNVQQAVEDLQYNLSTYCTGFATLVSPVADAELNFVLRRILEHPEIVRQVVPEGGTWKQVVDKLNGERRKWPGNASTLYNKAVFGKAIINAVANYTSNAFEDDAIFSNFISTVDAFITTQSILQKKWKLHQHGYRRDREEDEEPKYGDRERDYDRDHERDRDYGRDRQYEHEEDQDSYADEETPAASMMPPPESGKPATANGHAGEWDF